MNEDKEQIGLATEAIRDLLSKAGISDYSIEDYPLARGIVELKNSRIDIFYPYISTVEDNKENFILIGPISKYRVALFVRSDNKDDVSLDSMNNLIVGAESGSVANKFLELHKVQVEPTTEELSCLRMVLAQRIQACALGTLPGMYDSAINGIYSKIRYVETGLYADMYLALGPNLPEATVKTIKNTYEKLKKENYFDKKQKDYETKFAVFIKSMT